MIQIIGRPYDDSRTNESERVNQYIATARLPWESVASRGSFAIHRVLFIGLSDRILNHGSVQTFLDTAKAHASSGR